MIRILRHSQRQHLHRPSHETWRSFSGGGLSISDAFDMLLDFDEIRLESAVRYDPLCADETEIITYIYKGSLSQTDATGHSGVIHTGEFQRMSTGRRVHCKETGISQAGRVHLFRMSIRSAQAGIARGQDQMRFTEAQRRNALCVVVSQDGRNGSLRVCQDVLVYSAIIDFGRHIAYEISPGRSVWLHVICGKMTFRDTVLGQGDGVGIWGDRSLSLTVHADAEILLLDMGPAKLRSNPRRAKA